MSERIQTERPYFVEFDGDVLWFWRDTAGNLSCLDDYYWSSGCTCGAFPPIMNGIDMDTDEWARNVLRDPDVMARAQPMIGPLRD